MPEDQPGREVSFFQMSCVHDPAGMTNAPCELCRLQKIEASIKVLPRTEPSEISEFLGWPTHEWKILKTRWEQHYGLIKPSQVREKPVSEEGWNGRGPRYL